MRWLLKMIPAYRDLEMRIELSARALESMTKQLTEARSSQLRAEQEVQYLHDLIGDMRDDIKHSQAEALTAIKTIANASWQTRYGTALYPDVPQIPEARVLPSEPGAVAPGKTSVRLQVESKYKQFFDEAEKQWEEAQNRNTGRH